MDPPILIAHKFRHTLQFNITSNYTIHTVFCTVHRTTSLVVFLLITYQHPATQTKVKSTSLINTEKLTQCCHVGQRFWSYWTLWLCDLAITTCCGEMVVWWRWRSCFWGLFLLGVWGKVHNQHVKAGRLYPWIATTFDLNLRGWCTRIRIDYRYKHLLVKR